MEAGRQGQPDGLSLIYLSRIRLELALNVLMGLEIVLRLLMRVNGRVGRTKCMEGGLRRDKVYMAPT